MGKQGNRVYHIKRLTKQKIELLLTEGSWSRAKLAKLRRGVGKQPGELPELFEVLFVDMPEELYGKGDEVSYAEWAIYTSLTLFALHQQGKDQPMSIDGKTANKKAGNSLGAAVGYLVKQNDRDREPAIKRRFDAAITANDFIGFAHHARGLIQLLRAKDIPLDYPRFAADLYWYQFDEVRNRIRLRWGGDYYRVVQQATGKENGGNVIE